VIEQFITLFLKEGLFAGLTIYLIVKIRPEIVKLRTTLQDLKEHIHEERRYKEILKELKEKEE